MKLVSMKHLIPYMVSMTCNEHLLIAMQADADAKVDDCKYAYPI